MNEAEKLLLKYVPYIEGIDILGHPEEGRSASDDDYWYVFLPRFKKWYYTMCVGAGVDKNWSMRVTTASWEDIHNTGTGFCELCNDMMYDFHAGLDPKILVITLPDKTKVQVCRGCTFHVFTYRFEEYFE